MPLKLVIKSTKPDIFKGGVQKISYLDFHLCFIVNFLRIGVLGQFEILQDTGLASLKQKRDEHQYMRK